MLKKVIEYGTRLKATVEEVYPKENIVVLTAENGEGHIIAGGDHTIEPVVGAQVILEFVQGGPMKGYWKIVESDE